MTTSAATSTLAVENLMIGLDRAKGDQPRRLVEGVSFTVERGRTLGLVGESGSGKSLTCMAIPGLLPRGVQRLGGSITVDGVELGGLASDELERVRGTEIGVVFQEPMSSLNPAFTIGDQIAARLRRHEGLSKKEARLRVVDALGAVGIPRPDLRADAYPFELSGGMSQRAMIAMAIVGRPKVLLADEPTTALDVTVQAQILTLLKKLQEELEMAIIFVSHDLGVVKEMADDIAVMYAGQMVDHGPADRVLAKPAHPYTEGLLLASRPRGAGGDGLFVIPGAPPSDPGAVAGCRFAPRCRYAAEECTAQTALRPVAAAGQSRCTRLVDLDLQGVNSHV
ncbi:ABC transporter ATP-binding protein [Nocardioides sp. Bht2]|uniref:ABC transporter ATP-binding protein n=1 Tax=Nocardioides sp. Bht2 TaxID=3392297 RepID=UPI0039B37F74